MSKMALVDGVVIVTKAPHYLLDEDIPPNSIIHCTITGYGGTIYEPGVIAPQMAIEAYHKLIGVYGSERVILRIDPIIPTKECIEASYWVYSKAKGRVRISFIDLYKHVRKRFSDAGILGNLMFNSFHMPLDYRKRLLQDFKGVEICGEPGMECTGCISKRDLIAMALPTDVPSLTSFQRGECHCLAIKQELLSHKRQCAHKCLYCYWKYSK